MDKENTNVLKEMMDAIKFCIDSKKGKYSLDTYLDILGEYADRQIINEENEGLEYIGGKCSVKASGNDSRYIEFAVKLYFEDQHGEPVKKEAKRELPWNKFVSETVNIIGEKTLVYNIENPGGNQ